MHSGQQGRKGLWGLALIGVVLLVASCGVPGGDPCGGVDTLISCLSIVSIQPTATAGGDTSNVDAFRNPDCDGDVTTVDPEPFTDHNATVTFQNSPFPGTEGNPDVTIVSYSVTYELNSCPPEVTTCPPLPPIGPISQTLRVPAGDTAEGTFKFVPLAVKREFERLGGPEFPPVSYTARYVFTARTDVFNDDITIEGSAEFTIGNFDLCPQQ